MFCEAKAEALCVPSSRCLALVGPSVNRTQRQGMGWGESACQPCRGRSGAGGLPQPLSPQCSGKALPCLREASPGSYMLHEDLLCGGAHPQGARPKALGQSHVGGFASLMDRGP